MMLAPRKLKRPAIPPSLQALVDQALALEHPREIAARITLLQEAIRRVEAGEGDTTLYAFLQEDLAYAYYLNPIGDTLEQLKQASASFEAILHVCPRSKDPVIWAAARYGLGTIYGVWGGSNRPTKIEQAITCFEATLEVYTPEAYPMERARVLTDLGAAFLKRIKGGTPVENTEQAIRCLEAAAPVITKEVDLVTWISIQNNLGACYQDRQVGDRADNMERAIQCYQAILQTSTSESRPLQGTMMQLQLAMVQHNLGYVYTERVKGNREENIEQALQHYEAALKVLTQEKYPKDWARLQNNLGNLYRLRGTGIPAENQEQAIQYYEAALTVRTREAFPYEWANTQLNLGGLYMLRIRGNSEENIERAIAYHQAALEVLDPQKTANQWAAAYSGLATALKQRTTGNEMDHLDISIARYKEALKIRRRDVDPEGWALAQLNLGSTYGERAIWTGSRDRQRALRHYAAALTVYTREAFPQDWALIQHGLGNQHSWRHVRGLDWGIGTEQRAQAVKFFTAALQERTLSAFPDKHRETARALAKIEGERKNWEAAQHWYASAQEAEELLLALGAGIQGQDELLRANQEAASEEAFALAQIGRLAESAVVLESRRARGLAQARALAAADPSQISDPTRREAYRAARMALQETQQQLDASMPADLSESERRKATLARSETFRQAKAAFDTVVKDIRAAHDPADFFDAPVSTDTILRAARRSGPGHALVYLFDTIWGGLALAAISGDPESGVPAHFACLPLPTLKTLFLSSLVTAQAGGFIPRVVGGFALAQRGNSLTRLCADWPGDTFRSKAQALHHFRWRSFRDSRGFLVPLVWGVTRTRQVSSLDRAAQAVLRDKKLKKLADAPFEALSPENQSLLEARLDAQFLEQELEYVLRQLAQHIVRPLGHWLRDLGSPSVTLIPCGVLAALPILAAPVNNAKNPEEWETLGDWFSASAAPSARSLLDESPAVPQRSGVFALGNPRQSLGNIQHLPDLPWAEAEAEILVRLAGHPERMVLHRKATKNWLLETLQTGEVVDASCHGEFNTSDFLESRLLLAKEETLTLREALSGVANLHGLRLLMLSACQTAILDVAGARDEVHSLAAGMLQAGTQAVLGTLWSVNDRASYLLMARFAQEWFPHLDREPPSAALARAQRWLRQATVAEFRKWEAELPIPSLVTEAKGKAPHLLEALHVSQRRRGTRYKVQEADWNIQQWSLKQNDSDRPFAHPIYWAAFQIMGW